MDIELNPIEPNNNYGIINNELQLIEEKINIYFFKG
jgi:hypothetical protein